jgi:hypothetical protein
MSQCFGQDSNICCWIVLNTNSNLIKTGERKIMGLNYENLDETTRKYMIKEIERDIASGNLYLSKYFNSFGNQLWKDLLVAACEKFSDDWLSGQLRIRGCMASTHARRLPKGGFTTAKVPVTAPETLAEGEFNRFYARGLCSRAIEENILQVEVYRGKFVENPRPESELKIGAKIDTKKLLDDLRSAQGVEPCLGIPPGPNSGLTIRLCR